MRDSIVYVSYSSPLLDPGGATGVVDVYEAERRSSGWETVRRINPPGSEAQLWDLPGGVSPDHRYAFEMVEGFLSTLALGGPTEYLVSPDGTYELAGLGELGSEPFARGRWISEGGEHVIFTTGHDPDRQSEWCYSAGSNCKVLKLEPDAPPEGTGAVYDRSADGDTHVVSLLPGDNPPAAGEQAYYQGTSRDASSIAFKISGVLYVRVNNGDDLLEKTEEVASGDPTFAGLSADGRYLFYVAAGNIHRFDTTNGVDEQVNATGDAKVSNVSADGSHVYFISNSQIDGGVSGQPNLYVWSGASKYVATVAESDLVRTSGDASDFAALGNWTTRVVNPSFVQPGPGAEASRTTPSGNVFVFESRAKLTSDENAEHTEIYRYDDLSGSLTCVSCSGSLPETADARLQELTLTGITTVIHNVSNDGSRVFFETKEALDARDTDGVNDIYEWIEGNGGGGVPTLISSGKSPEYSLPEGVGSPSIPSPNVLLSVTPDSKDVVFLAQEPLVPGAPEGGTAGIYDARVNGGFPLPAVQPVCSEEGCRPAGSSGLPALSIPSPAGRQRNGNVRPRKHHRCHRRAGHKKRRHCSRRKTSKKGARSSVAASGGGADGAPQSQAGSLAPTADNPDSGAAAPVAAAGPFDEFGIEFVGATESTSVAGSHPDFTTNVSINHSINPSNNLPESPARAEEVRVSLPPGLTGNPNAVPKCKTGELVAFGNCPVESQVGVVRVNTTLVGEELFPLYNLEPPHPTDEVARFGFFIVAYTVFIDVNVRTAGDYGVTGTVHSSPGLSGLVSAETTFWGNPADHSHDPQRFTSAEVSKCHELGEGGTACLRPDKKREVELEPRALMTNPSTCQEGSVGFDVTSYQLPGSVFSASALLPPITECAGLPFEPNFSAVPTSRAAGAPTGLRTTLTLPQHEDPGERATATMREARVSLPAGMQIAAGAANWIGTCSEAQVGFHEEVTANCPDDSKLGTATITSPALSAPLEGGLYQRTPSPGHQFGLWLVTDDLGLHVKLPGELEPNHTSGRLTAVFRDLPQVPVSEIDLNIWGGARAPLQNPDRCGTYTTNYAFAPYSQDPPVSGQARMTIDQGCDRAFSPTLRGGVTHPVAGKFSPLVVDLAREDGQQEIRGFELELPDGELAKIKDVPLCPDAAAASGSCPADSRIGSVTAAAGPGPDPLWVPQPGKPQPAVYLAGPHEGSPFSVVTVAPAQAGPFDLGNVIVRSGLGLDPDTNRAVVKADPLPQFFEGVGLTYRRLHIVVDRPNFALNPTDCREMSVGSTVTSTSGALAHPAAPFQVDGCKRLKFKPKLSIKLKGGTKRAAYPALTAVLKARKGDANIAKVSVALPHSEFLAQEHIATICTRKQFAADKCPKNSIYGKATAKTPLLAQPLTGPVYLRSSNHPLPDLVVALGGELDVNLVGRIDSMNGGLRTTFGTVPDAPITKFVLKMRGGKKSLLTNSTDICHGKHRATVNIAAQNGRRLGLRPMMQTRGCSRGA